MPNRIKERRKELGLTQAELAKLVKITENYMNKIENEKKNINVMLAVRIAKALKSSVEDIFFEK